MDFLSHHGLNALLVSSSQWLKVWDSHETVKIVRNYLFVAGSSSPLWAQNKEQKKIVWNNMDRQTEKWKTNPDTTPKAQPIPSETAPSTTAQPLHCCLGAIHIVCNIVTDLQNNIIGDLNRPLCLYMNKTQASNLLCSHGFLSFHSKCNSLHCW